MGVATGKYGVKPENSCKMSNAAGANTAGGWLDIKLQTGAKIQCVPVSG